MLVEFPSISLIWGCWSTVCRCLSLKCRYSHRRFTRPPYRRKKEAARLQPSPTKRRYGVTALPHGPN
eukprot:10134027-Prorocentrum_lima.AAC.1